MYNYYGSSPTSCALPSPGTNDNGNVMGYWYQDSVNSSFSHTASYSYDALNRLSTAVATGSSTYNLSFGYDRYGNMTCVTNGQTNGPCPSWAFNTSTNQLTTSGFTYDAAGDLTKDSSNVTAHTYQWDAEGRVASVDSGSTWGFTYNAVGQRVQWAYSGGANQQLFDPSGGWLGVAGAYSLVRFGGPFMLVYTSSETYFNHLNQISSTTAMTNHAGTAVEDMLFYPWGDVWQSPGSGGYNFAELPYYDTTTNTSLTTFRLYSPNLGRWLSPDPVRGCVNFPQGQNLYAYVKDSPTNFTDPNGDVWAPFDCAPNSFLSHARPAYMGVDDGDNCLCDWDPEICEEVGGGGPPSGPVWCNCYLRFATEKWMGCYYWCGCSDGTTQEYKFRCSILQQYATEPCPNQCTTENGELVWFSGDVTGDPCGGWIKPPKPEPPHPPHGPWFPPWFPRPQPVPVPLMTRASGG